MSASRERALAALGHQRWDIAERELRGILAEDPNDGHAHASLALCLAEMDALAEAQTEADTAVGLTPDLDFAHYVRAEVLLKRQKYANAKQAATEAIRLDPHDANNHVMLARIHCAQLQWTECLSASDAGLACDPDHIGGANLRAVALTHLGRKDEAASTIADTLERAPENSMTHANQGWALLHRNQPQQALEHFREALRLDPTSDWAREGLLTALKAQHVVYRTMLAYFLFMSRQSGAVRWIIIIGILIGQRVLKVVAKQHPEWGIVVYPVIVLVAIFVFSTWLADPLMNLLMRFNRYGKYALTRDQTVQANLVGTCIAAAISLFVLELCLGIEHLPSILALLLTLPVSSIHNAEPFWPRRIRVIVTSCFALIAVFEIIMIFLTDMVGSGAHNISEMQPLLTAASFLMIVYIIGIFLWTLWVRIRS